MLKLDEIQKRLLREVADLHQVPEGAYNLRSNSQSAGRQSTANIEITSKEGVSGLEVRIRPGTNRGLDGISQHDNGGFLRIRFGTCVAELVDVHLLPV